MNLKTSMVLLLLAGSFPLESHAGPTQGTVQAVAESGVQANAELRSEYIQNEPLLIPISLVNPGASRVDIPDLATRPWLVEFHLVLPTGNDQVRKNTTPDDDPGARLSVAPRGQRRVLLEVPASSKLRPGEYSLEIQIQLDSETLVLPAHSMTIVPARPVSMDLSPQQHPSSRTEPLPSLWVHKGAESYDLYYHQAKGNNPERVTSDLFLYSSPANFQPILSASRARETRSGHVVWQTGARTIQILRLQRNSTPSSPSKVELPWPKTELEARGITSAKGELFLPLWVPAPRGGSGTIQMVRLNERGEPSFERLAQFERRPSISLSMIDDSGQPHLLLVHSGNLDRYSPRINNPSKQALPVPGIRLMRSRAGHQVIDLQVVALPETTHRPGALALLLTSLNEQQLTHSWISLNGSLLQEQSGVSLATDQEVLDIIANGWGIPGLSARNSDGSTFVIDLGHTYPVELTTTDTWQFYRSDDGAIFWRLTQDQGPIRTQRITP